ncbi:MAG: peptidoglycan DD-metalloendopeptidase family protein [Candidatus Wallbacteria bacterium]|nr:peptidoglycan DD-metalloendopeptidase family protein [Candidatus Wallbacteria bacterium]
MLPNARACSGRILAATVLVTAAVLAGFVGLGLQASPYDPVSGLGNKEAGSVGDEGYEVVSGDTLWAIAERFLGDGSRWPEVFDANHDQIENPNLIYPGQKFKVPGGKGKAPGAPDTGSNSGGGASSGGSGASGGVSARGANESFQRLPLDHGHITSGFGPRPSPCAGCSSFHKGVDISQPRGTPVYACGPGRVVQAYFEEGGGNTICIDHGGGYKSFYLHLQHGSFKVKVGDDVKPGQHIANVNSTGAFTTGDHLHFAVSKDGVLIDPQNVIHIPQGW